MLKAILVKVKEQIKEKAGVGAIVCLLALIVLLPLFLFLCLDVPYYLQYHRKMKDVADNVAATAITRINEEALAEGVLKLDYDVARTYMFESIEDWFDLEPLLYESNVPNVYLMKRKNIDPTTGQAKYSLLDHDPCVIEIKKGMAPVTNPDVLASTRIEFFIHTDNTTYTYRFTNGEQITVSTPTVGIYVQSVSHGIMFKWPMTVKKFGISEVSLDPYTPLLP